MRSMKELNYLFLFPEVLGKNTFMSRSVAMALISKLVSFFHFAYCKGIECMELNQLELSITFERLNGLDLNFILLDKIFTINTIKQMNAPSFEYSGHCINSRFITAPIDLFVCLAFG